MNSTQAASHMLSCLPLVKMQSVFSRIGALAAVIETFTASEEISLQTHSERVFTADSSVHQGGSRQCFISSHGNAQKHTGGCI